MLRYFLLVLLPVAVFSPISHAGILDAFLMPGPVVSAHAEFEKKCETCHLDLEKEKQSLLCLDCHDHENIARDIEEERGFHGKNSTVKEVPCKHCHTDHKGRDFQIVLLDKDVFDHRDTDFQLTGKHKSVSCASCHKEKRYSETPQTCISCHEADDSHQGNLGEKCDSCHTEKSWQEEKFNHDKDTKFKLEGKHRDVNCDLCHIGKKYKDTPKECISCHQINDVHNQRNGEKCHTCHNNDDWKEIIFDHKRDAKYALTGGHKDLSCTNCHKSDAYKKKLGKTCISCHKNDDLHNGLNGEKCKTCHTTVRWSDSRFNHDKATDFVLAGEHKKLACESCHRESAEKVKLEKSCISCHSDDDVHNEQQGSECSNCHSEEGWGEDVFFQHDITQFPLIGQHAVVACESCHLSGEFKNTNKECDSCHAEDDNHNGSLGTACQTCHNPNSWSNWLFDHTIQTEYPLTGKHDGLECNACHSEPLEERTIIGTRCISCHRADDEHKGRFGVDCARCHVTDSFDQVSYDY